MTPSDSTSTAKPRRRKPRAIHDEYDGQNWILATTEAEAREQAKADQEDEDYEVFVTFDGWMQNVGWDRDAYETRREFLAHSGLTSWWEGVGGAIDAHEETAKLRRSFLVEIKERESGDE